MTVTETQRPAGVGETLAAHSNHGGAGPARQPHPQGPASPARARQVLLEVVVPVYNEEADLSDNIRRLRVYLDAKLPFESLLTIADNGSTDKTWAIARSLSQQLAGTRAVHIDCPGRGRALRSVWERSDAEVVAYMDIDLSTDLRALRPLLRPILTGQADLAIGSRLAKGSQTQRSIRRDVISRAYNALLRTVLKSDYSDAQCGFKAMNAEVARVVLPQVLDNDWFFDTELLAVAQARGLRTVEVPVRWVEDPGSRVKLVRTALQDLRGVCRLLFSPTLREQRSLAAQRQAWGRAAKEPAVPSRRQRSLLGVSGIGRSAAL